MMLFFRKCETEKVPSSYNNPIKNALQQGLLNIEYVFTLNVSQHNLSQIATSVL